MSEEATKSRRRAARVKPDERIARRHLELVTEQWLAQLADRDAVLPLARRRVLVRRRPGLRRADASRSRPGAPLRPV
jgi:hypothetical protein